jgi:hypothetical protein
VPYALARDLFIEMVYYGPAILRFADQLPQRCWRTEATLTAEGKLKS